VTSRSLPSSRRAWRAFPASAERTVRLGLWSLQERRPDRSHQTLSIVRVWRPITLDRASRARLDRLRRSRNRPRRPPCGLWCSIRRAGSQRTSQRSLSAIYLGAWPPALADAMRGLQILGRNWFGYEANSGHRENAARLAGCRPGAVEREIEVHDVGFRLPGSPPGDEPRRPNASVSRRGRRGRPSRPGAFSERAFRAVATSPAAGWSAASGPANGPGNSQKMMTVKTGGSCHLPPSLSDFPAPLAGQDLPLSQWFVAVGAAPTAASRCASVLEASMPSRTTGHRCRARLSSGAARLVTVRSLAVTAALWAGASSSSCSRGPRTTTVTVIPRARFTGDRKVLLDVSVACSAPGSMTLFRRRFRTPSGRGARTGRRPGFRQRAVRTAFICRARSAAGREWVSPAGQAKIAVI